MILDKPLHDSAITIYDQEIEIVSESLTTDPIDNDTIKMYCWLVFINTILVKECFDRYVGKINSFFEGLTRTETG